MWRYLDSGYGPGGYNMALDESLALCQARSESPPTLRLYGWDPPAVSLGRFQDLYSEIDYLSCRAHGFDVVRRPTGGKAILHLNDFTYSVSMPFPSTDRRAAYRLFQQVSSAVISSLEELGVFSQVAAHRPGTSDPWCFTRPFGVDISVGDRKICGSAHRVYNGAFLQHGTIFMEMPGDILPRLAPVGSPIDRQLWTSNFRKRVISLSEAAERELSHHDVKQAFLKGFSRLFQADVLEGVPTRGEIDQAKELLATTYDSGFWLFHRKRDACSLPPQLLSPGEPRKRLKLRR